MTEILIRNGVQRTLASDFIISAWDATVNTDNAWQITSGSSQYSTWNEYEMTTTKNMVSVYSTTDTSTQSQQFLPRFYLASDSYSGNILSYPLMDFNQESAIRYNGSQDIFIDGTYNARVYMAVMRFDNITTDKKAFVLSIGESQSIGTTPLWTYADIHIYRNSSTNHDHLVSRVGQSYKSSRISNFVMDDIHVYAIVFDGSGYYIYLDNQLITSHSAISVGGLWGSDGLNWSSSVNTMWVGGKVGYLHLADTYTYYTGNYGIHAIVHVKYDDIGLQNGSAFPLAVNELCHYRYDLPSPPDTGHNSTVTVTLSSTEIIVFGSYNFGGTQQFL